MLETDKNLIAEAKRAREAAYAPYSKFAVGAAVLGASGKIYGGCNVENVSFSLTECAGRVAIYKAVSAGENDILAIAVAADAPEPITPCGACRQVIAEFNIPHVITVNLEDEIKEMTLEELIPDAFGRMA